jgi:hypothetical protein
MWRQPAHGAARRAAAQALLAAAFGLLATSAWAVGLPLPDDDGPLVSYQATVISRSEIVAIDRERRLLTLREGDEVFEAVADLRLRDFGDVRVGDLVEVQLTQALVLSLRPGTGIRERATLAARTDPSPAGQRPSGADLFEETIVIDVLDVDAQRRQLRVRDERARVRTLTVLDDDVMQAARAGDQLVMHYRRATAIAVKSMATH